jgi:hypothetical protein
MLLHDDRKIFLFINYFVSDNPERQKEIDYCVSTNAESPYFERVVSISKRDTKRRQPKVHWVQHFKRPNYRQFIEHCNQHYQGHICVLANIDITFDDTILMLYDIDLTKTLVALTRWKHNLVHGDARNQRTWTLNVGWSFGRYEHDEPKPNEQGRVLKPKGSYTQDVWAFQAPFEVDEKEADFTMGYMGCEHKIASIARKAGYRVVNPSKSIKATHWHDSEHRTYDTDSRFDVYCPTVPCFIEEIT